MQDFGVAVVAEVTGPTQFPYIMGTYKVKSHPYSRTQGVEAADRQKYRHISLKYELFSAEVNTRAKRR
jgi:hypothetical protein